MTIELVEQLEPSQTGRQSLRIQIGRDENEGVVMRCRARRRAWTDVDVLFCSANTANKFVRRLAGLAFGKRGDGSRDAVGVPMIDAKAVTALARS